MRRIREKACFHRPGALRLCRRASVQSGAIAIMAALLLPLMLAMLGFAIDLTRIYNRKVELQNVADAVALAAAGALDGTPAGIDRAVTAAADTAAGFAYSYNKASVSWSSEALTFGTTANGSSGWKDAVSAKASAGSLFFARVDTSKLDPEHGRVEYYFMPMVSSAIAGTSVTAASVAGRDSLNVLPLAICANLNTKATQLSSGELAEYGFRRGVNYNLMNLNPAAGNHTPENFLVNPIAPAGTVGTSMLSKLDVVAPFVCTGRLAIPSLFGADITVERSFPIGSLYQQLNSRFGTYVDPCNSSSAPADPNVKNFDIAAATWMKYPPDNLSANTLTGPADPLLTIAEKPAGATKTSYGPLWSYAKAAKYSSYLANGGVEPSAGYSTYATTDWATIYNPGLPATQSYPISTPYQTSGGSSAYKTFRNTRVLRIPLLQCPVPAGSKVTATVLGIGKFFMTVPASSSALHAEFAGLDTEAATGGNARLYQ
jgi:Flp pilus assembly protein TadG